MHDDLRRTFCRRKGFGHCAADERRRIVQQHDHRTFGGGKIISRQIGIEIGARQRRSGLRPLPGRRLAHPLQKLTNDHLADRRDVTATHLTAASGYRMSLNKAFTIEIDRLLSIGGARR